MKCDPSVLTMPTFTSQPVATKPVFVPFSLTITFNTYEEYYTASQGLANLVQKVREAYSKYN